MRLMTWGMRRFKRDHQTGESFTDWRQALQEARALRAQLPIETDSTDLFTKSGIGYVAAYAVRDHYAELAADELLWCQQIIIEEILNADAETDPENRTQKDPYAPSRPCAYVLARLLQDGIDQPTRNKIEEALAIAVTHASEEVRDYAANGIRDWLWQIDPTLAKVCVGGLFTLASTTHNIDDSQRNYTPQAQKELGNALQGAIADMRNAIETVVLNSSFHSQYSSPNSHLRVPMRKRPISLKYSRTL